MSLKMRLARGGAKRRPFYRIVVAEATAPRDGRFLEKLGTYNPMLPSEHAERLKLNVDRIRYWLSVGAQPTDRVTRFLAAGNLIPVRVTSMQSKKHLPNAKTLERQQEKTEKAAARTEVMSGD